MTGRTRPVQTYIALGIREWIEMQKTNTGATGDLLVCRVNGKVVRTAMKTPVGYGHVLADTPAARELAAMFAIDAQS